MMNRFYSFILVLILSGCVQFSQTSQVMPPAYLVRLTSFGGSNLCTGFLVSQVRIILPAHCAPFIYWVSNQYGQLSKISSVSTINSELDIAIANSEDRLYFPFENIFGKVNITQSSTIFGQCNLYWPHTPRVGTYFGKTQKHTIWGVDSCSGDSGSPLIQNGKVIGMVLKVAPNEITLPGTFVNGSVLYALDSEYILEFLEAN